MSMSDQEWPLWEVFIRSKQGLSHKHVGSLRASDAQLAVENARDVYLKENYMNFVCKRFVTLVVHTSESGDCLSRSRISQHH